MIGNRCRRYRSEQGAVLIHVAFAVVALVCVSAFVLDYGMLWVSRGQAQNASDAGAYAGAIALAYDDFNDRTDAGPAKNFARDAARRNFVWGEQPSVNYGDVTFPVCPDGTNSCVQVDVYRDTAHGNALPIWAGTLLGLSSQGVRARAIAQAATGNASECLKPWAIPDKWNDVYDDDAPVDVNTWTADDKFEKADKKGIPLPNPDVYVAPVKGGTNGTGFTLANDLGRKVTLKYPNGAGNQIAPGNYQPVALPIWNGVSRGGSDYRANIAGCNGVPIAEGDMLDTEPGAMIGPTKQGMQDLIALDPNAVWNESTNSVTGSCAQAATPCAPQSPRIVAIPVFDPNVFFDSQAAGRTQVKVVRILGFFIDRMQGNDVVGYFTTVPAVSVGTGGEVGSTASFSRTIKLVR